VAYRSKTISEAEFNKDIHDKGLLVIVQAFHEWKRYTRGNPKPIRVLTDHKTWVTFMTMKELNEQQARWRQELGQYNCKIEYPPGKEGGKPDALKGREGDLPTQEIKDSQKMLRSYCPRRETGISPNQRYQTQHSGNDRISR